MSGVSQKIVGTLGVKVVPDTRGFRKDVKQKLQKIQKTIKGDIRLGVSIKDDTKRKLQTDVEKLRKQLSQAVDLGVDLNEAALAQARGALEHIDATADIKAELDKASRQDVKITAKDIADDAKQIVKFTADIADYNLRPAATKLKKKLENSIHPEIKTRIKAAQGGIQKLKHEVKDQLEDVDAAVGIVAELKANAKHHIKETLEDITPKLKVTAKLKRGIKRRIKHKIERIHPVIKARVRLVGLWRSMARLRASFRYARTLLHRSMADVRRLNAMLAVTTMRIAAQLRYQLAALTVMSTALLGRLTRVVAITSLIAPLIGGALAVVGAGLSVTAAALGSIARALMSSLPALLALPGILAGATFSMAALIPVVKAMGETLSDFADDFKQLGADMGETAMAVARDQLRRTVEVLFPAIERGMGNISYAIGLIIRDLADAIASTRTLENISNIMDYTAQALAELAPGIAAFTRGLIDLSVLGADYLPDIARWITDIAHRFEAWVRRGMESGRLFDMVDNAVYSLKHLYRLLAAITTATTGLFRGMAGGDFPAIDDLADSYVRFSNAVNSSNVQETLAKFFNGSRAGVRAMVPGLKKLFDGLGHGLDSINAMMVESGRAVGAFAGAIGALFANDAFRAGFVALFSGIANGFEALEGAMAVFAPHMGDLLAVLGDMAQTLGETIGGLLSNTAFTGGVVTFFETIQDALQVIGNTLVTLAPAIGAILVTIGDVAHFVASVFGQLDNPAVADTIAGAFGRVSEVIHELEEKLPQVTAFVGDLIDTVKALFEHGISGAVTAILGEMGGVGSFIQDLLPKIQELAPVIGAATASIMLFAQALPLLTTIGEYIGLFTKAAPAIAAVSLVVAALSRVWPQVQEAMEPVMEILQRLWEEIAPVATEAIDILIDSLAEALLPIIEALAPLLEGLAPVIEALVPLLVPLAKAIGSILKLAGGIVAIIMIAVGAILEELAPAIEWLADKLGWFFDGFATVVNDWADHFIDAKEKVADFIHGVVDGIKEGIESWVRFFTAIADGLKGMKAGIKSFFTGGSFEEGFIQAVADARAERNRPTTLNEAILQDVSAKAKRGGMRSPEDFDAYSARGVKLFDGGNITNITINNPISQSDTDSIREEAALLGLAN